MEDDDLNPEPPEDATPSPGEPPQKTPRRGHVKSKGGGRNSRSDNRVDFKEVNAAALCNLLAIVTRWLPEGKVEGREFVARNPRRMDRNRGSFKVNLRTGRWADFATGDRGGDPISLAAYLFGLRQIEAARKLAHMLGLPGGEARHD